MVHAAKLRDGSAPGVLMVEKQPAVLAGERAARRQMPIVTHKSHSTFKRERRESRRESEARRGSASQRGLVSQR